MKKIQRVVNSSVQISIFSVLGKLMAFIFLFFSKSLPGQQLDTTRHDISDATTTVTFTVKFDKSSATKDGYYLNGYVVDISYEQAKKLNGKKIKISGKVSIVSGLNNKPKEYDENGQEIVRQGRAEDTKHILFPVIEILDE